MQTIGIAVLMLASLPARAQVYPRWFLVPEELSCASAAVGVALTGFYPDSTGGPAFQDAVLNALRAEEELVEGTKEFFAAGDATAIMGTNVRESVDSSRLGILAGTMKTVQRFTRGEMTVVLAAEGACELPAALSALVPVSLLGVPTWTTAPPMDARYDYAVGISQPYYYESSSWREAERNARLELARSARLKVRTRDRMLSDAATGSRYDAVWEEAVTVTLRGARVISRWRDAGTFMVLIRKPK